MTKSHKHEKHHRKSEKNDIILVPCKKDCKSDSKNVKIFNHKIQLELRDFVGISVPNTQFWVTLIIRKKGPFITIQLPAINFETGPISPESAQSIADGILIQVINGGYLYTSKGFLPCELRPNNILPITFFGPSNNGPNLAFSYNDTPDQLPTPNAGYLIQIDKDGALIIQGIGTVGNIILPGFQNLLPTTISYFAQKQCRISGNFRLSHGSINTTKFSDQFADFSNAVGVRETHVNDAFKKIATWIWEDNSNLDQTQTLMNVRVAVGKIKDGSVQLRSDQFLTDMRPLPGSAFRAYIFDTAVSINRADPNLIVASYSVTGLFFQDFFFSVPCATVSRDGGRTWPAPYVYTEFFASITGTTLTVTDLSYGRIQVGQRIYSVTAFGGVGVIPNTTIIALGTGTGGVGTYTVDTPHPIPVPGIPMVAGFPDNGPIPINTSLSFGNGDNRGVSADKFGNFWYLSTNSFDDSFNNINQPLLALSTDGINWTVEFNAPYLNDDGYPIFYDYPQLCFGGDGLGNYGLWLVASALPQFNESQDLSFLDEILLMVFIPITGRGLQGVGTPQHTFLTQFQNNASGTNITASIDGRVWTLGNGEETFAAYPGSAIINNRGLFKSPGPITDNWAGPWQSRAVNSIGIAVGIPAQYFSQPDFGMFTCAQTIIYDDKRQALYIVINGLSPYNSQNDQLLLYISRNNSQTWSEPISISNTDYANRGFQSMALDDVTGDLVFGWYDGRKNKDGSFTNLQYYATIIESKVLDELVKKIPLSDPLYSIPAGGFSDNVKSAGETKTAKTAKVDKSKFINKRHQLRIDMAKKYFEKK